MKPMGCCLIFAFSLFSLAAYGAEPSPQRGFKIVVDSTAPAEVKAAAERVLASVRQNTLLAAMAGGDVPASVTDSVALVSAEPGERAFSHLILIGLPSDPMIKAAWQHEAAVEENGLYVFGFGHLRGDIGYIESDRNPFLHARGIKRTPFETEVVTITGATPAGVALAADEFLKQGLSCGVVAESGKWTRAESSLLDRAPLQPSQMPPSVPEHAGDWSRVALTQASEDEYRGVLDDTGIEPQDIWRFKYYKPGVWDGAGAEKAFDQYSAGLHKRAYGNTLWRARFATAVEAQQAVGKIANAAKLQKAADRWTGKQPPYGPQRESAGDLALWQKDEVVFMSTLPTAATDALVKETVAQK